ncbi:MAG TPA: hypothetical protein VFT72_18455 [Opitutaceae bacterium]|nr:hypothetical protein [Opitutaceae bacterium]
MKPFLTGRRQVSAPALQSITGGGPKDAQIRPGAHDHSHGAGAGAQRPNPSVECVKQGDKIVRLIVTCGCGERIEIDCMYPAGG